MSLVTVDPTFPDDHGDSREQPSIPKRYPARIPQPRWIISQGFPAGSVMLSETTAP
jgi:hypothetical protein